MFYWGSKYLVYFRFEDINILYCLFFFFLFIILTSSIFAEINVEGITLIFAMKGFYYIMTTVVSSLPSTSLGTEEFPIQF